MVLPQKIYICSTAVSDGSTLAWAGGRRSPGAQRRFKRQEPGPQGQSSGCSFSGGGGRRRAGGGARSGGGGAAAARPGPGGRPGRGHGRRLVAQTAPSAPSLKREMPVVGPALECGTALAVELRRAAAQSRCCSAAWARRWADAKAPAADGSPDGRLVHRAARGQSMGVETMATP